MIYFLHHSPLIISNRLRNSVKHDWKNVDEDIRLMIPFNVYQSSAVQTHAAPHISFNQNIININFSSAIMMMGRIFTPTGNLTTHRQSIIRSRLPNDSQIHISLSDGLNLNARWNVKGNERAIDHFRRIIITGDGWVVKADIKFLSFSLETKFNRRAAAESWN